MRNVRVATVQMQSVNGDKPANLQKIRGFVEQAAREGAEIVCFPECCITGYWFLRNLNREAFAALAEPVCSGPSSRFLMELAKKHGMTIGAGLVERGDDGCFYNTFVVAMPNGEFRRHRKLHTFVSEFLSDGNEYTVFDTPQGCRVGVLICYDNNIVENARMMGLMDVDVLLAPHQTGGCASRAKFGMKTIDADLWENRNKDRAARAAIEAEFYGDKGRGWLMRWLPSRAHDNGFFLVFSNGVGRDDDEVRTGNAMVLDPYGRVIAETWAAEERIVVAELDSSLLERCTGRRWLTTRRPELYGRLTVPTGKERPTRVSRFEDGRR